VIELNIDCTEERRAPGIGTGRQKQLAF